MKSMSTSTPHFNNMLLHTACFSVETDQLLKQRAAAMDISQGELIRRYLMKGIRADRAACRREAQEKRQQAQQLLALACLQVLK